MICPKCQTANRENAKYCDECGYELPTVAPIAREMFDDGAEDGFLFAETVDLAGLDTIMDSSFVPPSRVQDAFEAAPTEDLPPRPLPPSVPHDAPAAPPAMGVRMPGMAPPVPQAPADVPAAPPQTRARSAAGAAGGAPAAGASQHTYMAYSQPGGAGGRGRRRWPRILLIVAAIVALVALAAVVATYALQMWGGKVVPDVTGNTQADAVYVLEENGFNVTVEQMVSDDVEGIVLSTVPVPGVRVAEGSDVTICVSAARIIPELVGKGSGEAEALMAQNGFTNLEFTRSKSNEPEGTVLAVAPAAGTRANADARIVIELAEPYIVPDVAGQNADAAIAALQAQGYHVATQLANTEDQPEGTAVSTEPAAGSVLNTGSDITLYLAHNRSVELVGLTHALFEGMSTVEYKGGTYELSRIGEIAYAGDDTCTFTVVVRPIQTVNWFGVETETRYGSYENVSGTVKWGSDNQVQSIEPAMQAR